MNISVARRIQRGISLAAGEWTYLRQKKMKGIKENLI
jgi:hypothetical protein